MSSLPTVKIGDTFIVKGESVVIVGYESNIKVDVMFTDGTVVTCQLYNLRQGVVKNPNAPYVSGVGYSGVGAFSSKTHPHEHKVWTHMLSRCYDKLCQSRGGNYVYEGCSVDASWHNFQTFSKDYIEMSKGVSGWHLEKDLLVKGNRVYSKANCVVVPQEINKLLIKSKAVRGAHCIGVYFNKREGKFRAQLSMNSINTMLGSYATESEAFMAYKLAKEAFIKEQANKWREQIDPRAYEALMNYQVEITD